jgi:hypothetical protein
MRRHDSLCEKLLSWELNGRLSRYDVTTAVIPATAKRQNSTDVSEENTAAIFMVEVLVMKGKNITTNYPSYNSQRYGGGILTRLQH